MNGWQKLGLSMAALVLFQALALLLVNVGVYAGLGDWRDSFYLGFIFLAFALVGGLIAWQIVEDRRP